MAQPLWTKEQLKNLIDMAKILGFSDDVEHFTELLHTKQYK